MYDIQDEYDGEGEHIHITLTDVTIFERQVSISHNANTGDISISVYEDEHDDYCDYMGKRLVAELKLGGYSV